MTKFTIIKQNLTTMIHQHVFFRTVQDSGSLGLILGLGIGIPVGLIIIVVTVIVAIYKKQQQRSKDLSSDIDDRRYANLFLWWRELFVKHDN